VRVGRDVRSPLIPKGGADILLGFEPAETYRYLPFANESTRIIMNVHPIIPIQVSMGLEEYPEVDVILDAVKQVNDHLLPINADALAAEVGYRMAASSVLIGAICAVDDFPIPRESLARALLLRVPRQHAEVNSRAFERGYETAHAEFSRQRPLARTNAGD